MNSQTKTANRLRWVPWLALAFLLVALVIWWRFDTDLRAAKLRVSIGSQVVNTPCGLIEYQEAGSGAPILSVHGSGGGFDQGMAFARPLARKGFRVIAMSRFGYLRTPMRIDASAGAQADAHVCLLDALGIAEAAVMGGSAGAPSALQMAIRHASRVSALIMLVPLTYKPQDVASSAPPMPAWVENIMMTALGSDFLFWTASHVARKQMIGNVLATTPDILLTASASEVTRVNTMLDEILPISARAAGLRSDTLASKHLTPSPLEAITAPTLIISARDDGYGTYASAQYTATRIKGARFIGFEQGGHTWVGHNDDVMDAIAALVPRTSPVPAPKAAP